MAKEKTRKKCPTCGAYVFQGPYDRGEIINGKMKVKSQVYQCLNCHHISPLEAVDGLAGLPDEPMPDYTHLVEEETEE